MNSEFRIQLTNLPIFQLTNLPIDALPTRARVIRNRLSRLNIHVKDDRRLALRADFDLVGAGLEIQVLEGAVEVVDDPDVVAVCVDLRVAWRALNADAAVGDAGLHG